MNWNKKGDKNSKEAGKVLFDEKRANELFMLFLVVSRSCRQKWLK